MSQSIREWTAVDLPLIREFTDRAIGQGYYSLQELAAILERSSKDGQVFSLLLVDKKGKIRGVRITYPPGKWEHGKGQGLCPELWRCPLADTAYFQSLFVDPSTTGQGWGKKLSTESLNMLQKHGAKAVVCHSWKESPHDSSGRYLRSLGFELVKEHPKYWFHVDYQCPRCGRPCLCTAQEMIKYL